MRYREFSDRLDQFRVFEDKIDPINSIDPKIHDTHKCLELKIRQSIFKYNFNDFKISFDTIINNFQPESP